MHLLLTKPGFLSSEFLAGRRAKYLDPVRMYLFVSALFFVLFYSIVGDISIRKFPTYDVHYGVSVDSTGNEHLTGDLREGKHESDSSIKFGILENLPPELRNGTAYYDSVQSTLPAAKRDGLVDRYFSRKQAAMYQSYRHDKIGFMEKGVNNFLHSLSKIVFVTMPLFAFFLYLLYVRSRKKYYYVSHLIFTLHLYIVNFIWMILALFIKYLPAGRDAAALVLFILSFGYALLAMKRFYGQGIFKTFVKFSVLGVLSFFMLLAASTLLFLNSYFSVAGGGH